MEVGRHGSAQMPASESHWSNLYSWRICADSGCLRMAIGRWRDRLGQISPAAPSNPAETARSGRKRGCVARSSVAAACYDQRECGLDTGVENMSSLDRRQVAVRRSPAEADDQGYMSGTPAERLSEVWELTREVWAFVDGRQHAEQRLQRDVAVLVGRGR